MQRAGVRAGSQERVAAGDLAKVIRRARHHRNSVAEALGDGLRDESGNATSEGRGRLENHVAALDVGLHALAPSVAKDRGEVFHRQPVLAADVDSAQQRDVGPGRLGTAPSRPGADTDGPPTAEPRRARRRPEACRDDITSCFKAAGLISD